MFGVTMAQIYDDSDDTDPEFIPEGSSDGLTEDAEYEYYEDHEEDEEDNDEDKDKEDEDEEDEDECEDEEEDEDECEDDEDKDEEDEEDEDECEDDEDECEDNDEEEGYKNPQIMFFVKQQPPITLFMQKQTHRKRQRSRSMSRSRSVSPEIKQKKQKYQDIMKKYNKYEKAHFEEMEEHEKDQLVALEKKLEESDFNTPEPLRFKFLKLNICSTVKNIIISKLEQLNRMTPCSGEYFKLSNWINTLAKIPIGKYHTLPITNLDADIATYLQGVKQTIDGNIFGHEETKDQIIRILAQWISNPNSNGYVIGIQGSPGVGKTKLIKEGICKAMNYPYAFISLGGISDASYLTGHHYTYEGATYGKIIECLIKSRVMNPVFLFDELDKVSNTSRGDEIINTLIHITDPVQNDRYSDKYFEEIDLDLSKALIIFTYNDENLINPILRDRMITIKVSGYNAKQKLTICKNYILPELVPQYNMKKEDIIIDESLLKNIIDTNGNEEGVRNLKRTLNDILSCVNMMRYIPTDGIEVKFPFHVTSEYYNKYCNKSDYKKTNKLLSMYT